MEFRRNDRRRRRVVMDEYSDAPQSHDDSTTPRSADEVQPGRAYDRRAGRRWQRKTTDLLPKRIIPVVFVVSAVVLTITGLHLLSARANQWQPNLGPTAVQSIKLDGSKNLATWVSSFYFILASMIAVQIYALRQHRQDDYRGMYRMWLWLSAWLMLASISSVADINLLLASVAQYVFSAPGLTTGSLTWIGIKTGLLALIVARWSYEVRRCPASLSIVIFMGLALGGAVLSDWPPFQQVVTGWLPAASSSLTLIAAGACLLAGVSFGRRVYLEAHGLRSEGRSRAPAAARTRSRKTVEPDVDRRNVAERAPRESTVTPSPIPSAKSSRKKKKRPSKPVQNQAEKAKSDRPAQPAHGSSMASLNDQQLLELDKDQVDLLSKSQRRRLRKLQRRQKQAA